jgi:hypothetical protein
MASDTEHDIWTATDVAHRVLEAAETLTLCPRAAGPRHFGNSMPEPLRRACDSYADDRTRFRRRPTAAALDRMEQCWRWVNALDDADQRKLLYGWASAKTGRGRSLNILALEGGMSDRTLRREITRICRKMAARLNADRVPKLTCASDAPQADFDPVPDSATPPVATPNHWRATNARPEIDPEGPAKRTIPR